MGNRLLVARDAPRSGTRWAMIFKRQPLLNMRSQCWYDYQGARCEDLTVICDWLRLVQNTVAKYGIWSDNIWNLDETGFTMGVISSGIVITDAVRHRMSKSVQPGNREWVTVIQGINTEGWAGPAIYHGCKLIFLLQLVLRYQPPERLGYRYNLRWLDR